jgi:hypothetical protein
MDASIGLYGFAVLLVLSSLVVTFYREFATGWVSGQSDFISGDLLPST